LYGLPPGVFGTDQYAWVDPFAPTSLEELRGGQGFMVASLVAPFVPKVANLALGAFDELGLSVRPVWGELGSGTLGQTAVGGVGGAWSVESVVNLAVVDTMMARYGTAGSGVYSASLAVTWVDSAAASSFLSLDLFGGRASQIPGAINVDIIAESGVRASATQLPFRVGSIDEIFTSNPYIPVEMGGTRDIMQWLPEAARVLKPGGQLTINAMVNNPYGWLPSTQVLESLGLRIVQEQGPLLPRFGNQVFRYSDGGMIERPVLSTVLEKVH
jgi:hypothetical protein